MGVSRRCLFCEKDFGCVSLKLIHTKLCRLLKREGLDGLIRKSWRELGVTEHWLLEEDDAIEWR